MGERRHGLAVGPFGYPEKVQGLDAPPRALPGKEGLVPGCWPCRGMVALGCLPLVRSVQAEDVARPR